MFGLLRGMAHGRIWRVRLTPEGGFAIQLVNKTGAPSVIGTLVEIDDDTDNAFDFNGADGDHCIGAVYEGGVADASLCWVVVAGRCQVLLKDTKASTRGFWVGSSDAAGRADATFGAGPPGGGVPELDNHMLEIGHALESVVGGDDKLCFIILHPN